MKLTYKQWGQIISLARADYEKKVIKYKKAYATKKDDWDEPPAVKTAREAKDEAYELLQELETQAF